MMRMVVSDQSTGPGVGRRLPAGWKKERKATTWHQTSADRISAPLIIDLTAGDLTEKMKAACRDF